MEAYTINPETVLQDMYRDWFLCDCRLCILSWRRSVGLWNVGPREERRTYVGPGPISALTRARNGYRLVPVAYYILTTRHLALHKGTPERCQ